VSIVSNVRLMIECRRWNWVIFSAASSSIFLMLRFARLNPFGSRKIPKINLQYIAFAGIEKTDRFLIILVPLCILADFVLLLLFDECSLFTKGFWGSVWREWSSAAKQLYEWTTALLFKTKETFVNSAQAKAKVE
jgi:hypothetical protein